MKVTRRRFIQCALLASGSILFPLRARAQEDWAPAYMRLSKKKLEARKDQAYEIMSSCELCPRRCGVDRNSEEQGFCRAPKKVKVYGSHAHFGEEIPLVGSHGSGTIFFSDCNLRCVFCQNWPIAHEGRGREISNQELAEMMLDLQSHGCHNINLVTPTHVMPHILAAVSIAREKGLRIPLVYNTSGYERVEILKLLDGIVDIYLPDMKYMHGEHAARYSSGARDYPQVARAAVLEMHRQVSGLETDNQGFALRGLMIRHLVMPNRVAGTREFVRWVAENLPLSTYVNIMAQYRVEYKAYDYPEIARGITAEEFLEAMDWAEEAGLTRLDEHSLRMRDFYLRGRSTKSLFRPSRPETAIFPPGPKTTPPAAPRA